MKKLAFLETILNYQNLFMKTICISIILLCATKIFAQDFAPVGAKWYYTERYFLSNDIGFLYAESVKDTIVKGKNCRKIVNDIICGGYAASVNYVYQQDSVVYFYNDSTDSFQILHNFKAKKGDTWITVFPVMGMTDSLRATVDTVFMVDINGHNLIRQEIKYTRGDNIDSDSRYYWATVTETIGDSHLLFNLYSLKITCDGEMSQGLRCYEDPNFGAYSTGIASSCTYTSIKDKNAESTFKVFPNPANSSIEINILSKGKVMYEISDFTGKIVRSGNFVSKVRVELNGLSKGVYLLSLKNNGKAIGSTKIIKN
jgi:hypothetical protein